MTRSLLEDAFNHHIWATEQLLEACARLNTEQLGTAVPGTYGSVLEILRHIVANDCFDLWIFGAETTDVAKADQSDVAGLRAINAQNGAGWLRILAGELDPDAVLKEVDPGDGFQRLAPVGVRLAQALHHGNDHRSQVCTALTALGIEPPRHSALDFGLNSGSVTETFPVS